VGPTVAFRLAIKRVVVIFPIPLIDQGPGETSRTCNAQQFEDPSAIAPRVTLDAIRNSRF
jgi:hypothetical protein